MGNSQILWELRNVSKIFSGFRALNNMNLKIKSGEIHALMGENGCGKSTLIKCLSGVHQPEEGKMFYKGEEIIVSNPIMAQKLGVATIFQEFSSVSSLSVAENIFLGRAPKTKSGIIDWQKMKEESVRILKQLDIDLDPDQIVGSLSVAQQQLVEIAKALSTESSLLIMDEPTAALGQSEIIRLHKLVKKLRDEGYAIIYISHRLDEVVDLVDCVTVMRDGCIAGTCAKEEISIDSIVKLMIGDNVIEEHYPKVNNTKNEVLFEVENLSSNHGVKNVSFQIKKGEVLGLAGLIGSGRTEIASAIFGAHKMTSGKISLHSRSFFTTKMKSPKYAINNGIAFVSENRKYDGLFMNFDSAAENITIVKLKNILKQLFLDLKKERSVGEEYVKILKITPACLEKSVKFLSGGNQQKVVIAKWLFSEADLFVLDEPTQGIDVQAKVEVYQLINKLTEAGKAVLLISSDFPELLAMSDRVAIVSDGKILKTEQANKLDRPKLMQIVLGKQLGGVN